MEQKEKLIDGCAANGISPEIAEKFWNLVEPFDRYGFNRSHAVCYAVIGYQTAYLKTHYPTEFMTSLLNADSGDIERIAFLVGECKKMGIAVLPPDVNKSSEYFTPEGNNIRFGLAVIKNVGNAVVEAIIQSRGRGGSFANLSDLLNRVHHKDLNKKSLESLIKSGALDSLSVERNQLFHNLDDILKWHGLLKKESQTNQIGLFGQTALAAKNFRFKAADSATSREKLAWEKELLGLYVSDHPLNDYRYKIIAAKVKPIKEILTSTDERQRYNIAGIISKIQKVLTKAGKPMIFAKIEDFNDALEVIVFSDILLNNSAIWQENEMVQITGRLSLKNGEPKLICENAVNL